jgi:glycosyltransferase involved in cell wall biosynthesis
MLSEITPVLLTHNEERNIDRTLSRLTWASRIVLVDSGSTDNTPSIVSKYPNVEFFQHKFVSHADQWSYAIDETRITTPWILRLDADYLMTDQLIAEISQLDPHAQVSAYRIKFDYAVFSRKLISSLYPPNTVLLRRGKFKIIDDGHTERWEVAGMVIDLKARICHDDRKTIKTWLNAQSAYMERELVSFEKKQSGWKGWVRRHPPLAPLLIGLYSLVGKGQILNGRPGIYYALQRTVAEGILALMILERTLEEGSADAGTKNQPEL